MSQLSDYAENQIADHMFRTATWSKPAGLYIALFTAAPSDSGGGTEVSGGSYARVNAGAPANANWEGTHGSVTGASSGTNGRIRNAAALTFPAPTADWGTVTHIGIFDASSGGNLLIWSALAASKTISNGDQAPAIAINGLAVTFA
jgi:hypothetical protein